MVIRERFSYQAIHDVLSGLLEQDVHAKRVNSLCDATLGVLHSGSLAVCTIGQGLAAARSLKPKHAIKQVDRLLSNSAINVDDILRWVPFVIGARDHRGGHGLDRLRCRQTGHHHAGTDHRSRSLDTSGLADRSPEREQNTGNCSPPSARAHDRLTGECCA